MIIRLLCFAFYIVLLFSFCKQASTKPSKAKQEIATIKFSLGQWSFHKALFEGKMTTEGFIVSAKALGFDGVDFVNQFFLEKSEDFEFLGRLKYVSDSVGIRNVMILVDAAGEFGVADSSLRIEAIEAHKKWIVAAKYLGCSSIRVNARGDGDPDEIKMRCVQSISELAAFAEGQGIDILIENHGGISNNGGWLASLIQEINRDNVKALADFDNWCIERENGVLWGAPCVNEYDRYQGMEELLPKASAISAKAFDFDEKGNETHIDFKKMTELIKASNYKGYIGIEYEGASLDPKEGVLRTKELLERCWEG